jgi:hypothetical protein
MSLFRAMRDSKNFKVRINAASAVHSMPDRRLYGSETSFNSIWEDLLIALDNADSVDDFSEFKYKDTLQKQVRTRFSMNWVIPVSSDFINSC